MDQIKPVVTEKNEYEKRQVTKVTNFRKFLTTNFLLYWKGPPFSQKKGLKQDENYQFKTCFNELSKYL